MTAWAPNNSKRIHQKFYMKSFKKVYNNNNNNNNNNFLLMIQQLEVGDLTLNVSF